MRLMLSVETVMKVMETKYRWFIFGEENDYFWVARQGAHFED